jgi:receptor protein-tyrosine kinase
MRGDGALAVISRRKWIVIATALIFIVTAAVVSKSLEKIYAAESTLLVALPQHTSAFDTVQASQALSRSYADIITNPNLAQQVAQRMGGGMTKATVGDETSVNVVPDTQLLKIHAEDPSPQRAKQLADTYAQTFIDFAKSGLSQQTGATVSIAVPAALPSQAARPKPTLYTLIAAIFGLGLGLALAFARDRLDRRLRTAEEIESEFEDAVILARVPRRGRSDTARFAFNEAFRILRTSLQFSRAGGRPLSSIAVTSWQAGEGKTLTSAQLAIATAETGSRVAVVEADFRRPALQSRVMPDSQPLRPGLSNYLVESAELDDVLYPTPLPGITLIPAGPLPPSPSALLEAPRGRALVEELLRRFDTVIFDCAPLSVGAEAAVISSWCEGVVLLADLTQVTDRSIREALRRLGAVQADLLGLVINRDRSLEPSAYAYYAPRESQGPDADAGRPGVPSEPISRG